MSKIGIIADFDWPKLMKMCELWAKMEEMKQLARSPVIKSKVKKTTKPDGTIIEEGGNPTYNIFWTEYYRLLDRYDKMASQFCMGSQNRAGIGGIQKNEKNDKKAKFFEKYNA
jgi:hypothetical protein